MTPGLNALSASALADLAGTTAVEVQRLVELGTLAPRDGTGPFLEAAPYRRWAVHSPLIYRVSARIGHAAGHARQRPGGHGIARMGPDEPMRGGRVGDRAAAAEVAAQLGVDVLPLMNTALLAIYRRQQELSWTEHLVEHLEGEFEAAGLTRSATRRHKRSSSRPGRAGWVGPWHDGLLAASRLRVRAWLA